ncbi:MAG TPA: phospholipase D-like domain-containing protein, partial [Mucilaginibacter sp.]|nr:phospholipase D-like domain-containing protein [Mucilaginibacter sp.]
TGARCLVDVFVERWKAHPKHIDLDKDRKSGGKGPLIGENDRLRENEKAPVNGEKPLGDQYVAIARTFNFVSKSIKCVKEQSIKYSMLGAIQAARKFIYIEDQYLWNFDAAEAIGKALQNLQYVIILISHVDQVKSAANPDGGEWAHYTFMQVIKANCKEEHYDKVKVFHRVFKDTGGLGRHTYVHAKCWVFDDELAVIGSANCNRRGWESDSEVAAAIFDEKNPRNRRSFAQTLRMGLWSEHLGLTEDKVFNWLGGDKLWPAFGDERKKECSVVYYDIGLDKDPVWPIPQPSTTISWTTIDPGDGNLGGCGYTPTEV